MKSATRLAILGLLAIVLSSCATAYRQQAPGRPVSPGQLFPGNVLDIRAPDSEGWLLIAFNSDAVVFAKHAAAPNETYAAEVERFEPPKSASPEEFAAFVKEAITKQTNPERFDVRSMDIRQSDARPYPCVSVEYTALDKKARTAPNTKEELLLQAISLYCRHPSKPDVGFAIVFSHRGEALDPGLRQSAESFIRNVEVPGR